MNDGTQTSKKKILKQGAKVRLKKSTMESSEGQEQSVKIAIAVVKGVGVGILTLFLLLFLFAVAIHKEWLMEEQSSGIVLVSYLLASLVGGLFATSFVGQYSLLIGSSVGLLLFFLFMLVGYCIYPSAGFGNGGYEILFAALVGGGMAKIFYHKKRKNH